MRDLHTGRLVRIDLVARKHRRAHSLATYLAVAAVAGTILYLVRSGTRGLDESSHDRCHHVQVAEKLISDRISLSPGRGKRYDFNLRARREVLIDIRATPTSASVWLLPTKDASAQQAHSRHTASSVRPILSKENVLIVTAAETLPSGDWTILIEPSGRPGKTDETTVTTEVTIR